MDASGKMTWREKREIYGIWMVNRIQLQLLYGTHQYIQWICQILKSKRQMSFVSMTETENQENKQWILTSRTSRRCQIFSHHKNWWGFCWVNGTSHSWMLSCLVAVWLSWDSHSTKQTSRGPMDPRKGKEGILVSPVPSAQLYCFWYSWFGH